MKSKRLFSLVLTLCMLISVLPTTVFAADEPLPDYVPANGGWGEAGTEYENTYFVVETNGYPTSKAIDLKDGTTLDLTYADDYTGSLSTLFKAQGDLNVISDGQQFSFNSKELCSYPDGATITLKNLNWTTSRELYSFFAKAGTIVYEGTCSLPGAYAVKLSGTLTFMPKDENSILNIEKYRIDPNFQTRTGKVIFDGGKVNVAKVIMAWPR